MRETSHLSVLSNNMDKRTVLLCLTVYLTAISLVAVIITICDKYKAKHDKRRVPEASLFLIVFLGGALTEFLTMKLVHHKTLHKKFMLGLPMICLVHIVMIYLFLSVDL